MKVKIGDRSVTLNDNQNLLSLLNDQGIQLNGVAVAVNDIVVPKNNWDNHQLHEGDNVLVIKATAGG